MLLSIYKTYLRSFRWIDAHPKLSDALLYALAAATATEIFMYA